ncbi:MAG: phospho-N-acetylmuramoyl-pentapeptide-transferase [Oscillospiraceae bacterium]|jgi:phospho-N-acetylmuramoyl-pentapeptide-transferase|nr:phospho-N-acetylmuramoyl-pentapeptide-transferase [Oscillospiraceae bacterium]
MNTLITAFAIAFAAAAASVFVALPILRRLNAVQHIRQDGPASHLAKQGTPILGGVTFIFAVALVSFTVGLPNIKRGDYTALLPLALAAVYGVIGFIDDIEKLRKKHNLGLTASQKFILQLVIALAFVLLVRAAGNLTPNLYIPFANITVPLPEPVYLAFAAFVIVAEVNGANLTDGADGLAAGVTLPIAVCFAAISLLGGAAGGLKASGAGIYSAAFAGGLLGFLLFNMHPAKLFMGETGAQFIGGSVAALAFVLDMPLILITLGFVYFIEALSDVIQVGWFKLSHGKRFFRMAPIHHHFELSGWSEYKLFFVFTGVSAAFAILSYFGVRMRYWV